MRGTLNLIERNDHSQTVLEHGHEGVNLTCVISIFYLQKINKKMNNKKQFPN